MFGDSLQLSRNEFGQSLSDLTAGPSITTMQNVATTGWASGGLAASAAFGDEESQADAQLGFARANRNLMRRETPLLNSWYTHLAYERLLVDTLFEMSAGDPDAVQRSYDTTVRYAAEKGQGYYAPPGSGLNWRAPDFGNAIGQPAAEENMGRE